jgi:hydroxylysine kinase
MDVAHAVMAGYSSLLPLTLAEQSLLHTLTCARLCQSVVMSSYSFAKNPANTYLLITSAPGWTALGKLVAMDAEEVGRFNGGATTE